MGKALLFLGLSAVVGCGSDGDDALDLPPVSLAGPGIPGVRVYFQNADSSLVLATTTDNGLASAVMAPGGFVTAVEEFMTYRPDDELGHPSIFVRGIITFSDVQPGDDLSMATIGDPYPNDHDGVEANLFVNPDPTVSGGHYDIVTPNGCGSREGITREDGSLGGGHAFRCGFSTDLMITASDDQGTLLSSIHTDDVELAQGGSIDLTNELYVPAEDWTFEYTNARPGITSFVMSSDLRGPHGPLFEVSDQGTFVNGTSTTTTHTRPGNDFDLQATYTAFSGTNTEHEIVEWGPPSTTYSRSLDMLLPDVLTLPDYDIATRTMSWTMGPGAAPDFMTGVIFISRSGETEYSWGIIAPLDVDPSVRYPVLPAPDDIFNPRAGDVVNSPQINTWKVVPGGYDSVRETFGPHRSLSPTPVGVPDRILFTDSAAGTMVRATTRASAKRDPFDPRTSR